MFSYLKDFVTSCPLAEGQVAAARPPQLQKLHALLCDWAAASSPAQYIQTASNISNALGGKSMWGCPSLPEHAHLLSLLCALCRGATQTKLGMFSLWETNIITHLQQRSPTAKNQGSKHCPNKPFSVQVITLLYWNGFLCMSKLSENHLFFEEML